MQQISFDSNGQKLWVKIEMLGVYLIFYTYELLPGDNETGDTVLTNPNVGGTNRDNSGRGTYYVPVINNYSPNEPLVNYDQRFIDVTFFIKQEEDDAGFTISVSLLQGDDYNNNPIVLGTVSNDPTKNTLASNGGPNIELEFEIIKK